MNYAGRWVVVTGIRSPTPEGAETVAGKLTAVVGRRPAGIIFGGAAGVDTIALKAAATARRSADTPKLVVIVPGLVGQQPREAQRFINMHSDETIELGLDLSRPGSYAARNGRMITEGRLRDETETPILLAFPADNGIQGGTTMTIDLAAGWGVEIDRVPIPVAANGAD
jgi:hypothetical protein